MHKNYANGKKTIYKHYTKIKKTVNQLYIKITHKLYIKVYKSHIKNIKLLQQICIFITFVTIYFYFHLEDR